MAVRFEAGNDSARGRRIVNARLAAAKTYFARSRKLLDTFHGHVEPLVERAIRANGITLHALSAESQEPGDRRENLRLLDVLTWHPFTDTDGVPLHLLTSPYTERFDGAYLEAFRWDHRNFVELREADQKAGVDPDVYLHYLNAHRGGSRSVAGVARVFDCAELARVSLLDGDSQFALVSGSTVDAAVHIPRKSEWRDKRRNVAESILKVHAGIGDALGYHGEVAVMKDFATLILYPGIVQHVMAELKQIKDSICRSNQILATIKTELEAELRNAKIEADIEIREEGKSLGSLALKAKLDFEVRLLRALSRGGLDSDSISIDIRDPREDHLQLDVLIEGVPTRIQLYDDSLIFTTPDRTRSTILDRTPTSVFRPLHKLSRDFGAARVIVKSFAGSIEDKHLIRALRKIQTEILPKCIARVLKGGTMQNYRLAVQDYVSDPKPNGYQSIHVHVLSNGRIASTFAPFEFQLRTEEMDFCSRKGGAAHALYKGDGPESAQVATAVLSTLSKSPQASVPTPVTDTTFNFTVLANGDPARTVVVKEDTLILDALVQAGVNLSRISKTGLSLKGQSNGVKLTGKVETDMEVEVRYVNSRKEGHLLDPANSQLLKHLTSLSESEDTLSQLRTISNS